MNLFLTVAWRSTKLWYLKNAESMSATVSYYTLFALAPLLLMMVLFSSIFYGRDFVIQSLDAWGAVLGKEVLTMLHTTVFNLETISTGYSVPLLALLFFSWAIITMLNTFTTGLHTLWGVSHSGLRGWVYRTYRSVLFVVCFEVYLFILIGAGFFVTKFVDSTGMFGLIFIKPIFFILATTLLFSLAYGVLSRESPPLFARLAGGLIASILLLIAKILVAFYITQTLVPGLFGTAGLVLVILIWVYVSAAVIYYGAAFASILDTTVRGNIT